MWRRPWSWSCVEVVVVGWWPRGGRGMGEVGRGGRRGKGVEVVEEAAVGMRPRERRER
jgi:hypothetical protein